MPIHEKTPPFVTIWPRYFHPSFSKAFFYPSLSSLPHSPCPRGVYRSSGCGDTVTAVLEELEGREPSVESLVRVPRVSLGLPSLCWRFCWLSLWPISLSGVGVGRWVLIHICWTFRPLQCWAAHRAQCEVGRVNSKVCVYVENVDL